MLLLAMLMLHNPSLNIVKLDACANKSEITFTEITGNLVAIEYAPCSEDI